MSVNEFELIEQIFSRLTGGDDSVRCGIGDDAAILRFPGGSDLVITMDTLVSGVHFFHDADACDVGFKSLAVNLSDMAAMSAQPRWVTLSLTLPESDRDWLTSFSHGFAGVAQKYNVSLVGGDISRGPLSITCQVTGIVQNGGGTGRSGARPGDGVYVSGRLGLAALALRLLDREGRDPSAVPENCLERLLRPVPRVEVGMALAGTASAMIDLSDGLVGDMGHLLAASGAGAEVALDSLPVMNEGKGGFGSEEIVQMAVVGGDDYELCFTVPADKEASLQEIAAEVDCPLTRIGRIVEGSGIRWLDTAGNEVNLDVESYHHF